MNNFLQSNLPASWFSIACIFNSFPQMHLKSCLFLLKCYGTLPWQFAVPLITLWHWHVTTFNAAALFHSIDVTLPHCWYCLSCWERESKLARMSASRWLSCCPDVARIALIWVIILISLIADISAYRPHRLNAVTVNSCRLWLALLLTMICGSKRSQRIKIDERWKRSSIITALVWIRFLIVSYVNFLMKHFWIVALI